MQNQAAALQVSTVVTRNLSRTINHIRDSVFAIDRCPAVGAAADHQLAIQHVRTLLIASEGTISTIRNQERATMQRLEQDIKEKAKEATRLRMRRLRAHRRALSLVAALSEPWPLLMLQDGAVEVEVEAAQAAIEEHVEAHVEAVQAAQAAIEDRVVVAKAEVEGKDHVEAVQAAQVAIENPVLPFTDADADTDDCTQFETPAKRRRK